MVFVLTISRRIFCKRCSNRANVWKGEGEHVRHLRDARHEASQLHLFKLPLVLYHIALAFPLFHMQTPTIGWNRCD